VFAFNTKYSRIKLHSSVILKLLKF